MMQNHVEFLKIMRLMNKMTQKELANKAGLTPSTMSRIENYKENPSWNTLIKICEVLKVSIIFRRD